MRWLFMAVLVFLVACVLSIIWLNDTGELTQGSPTPTQQNPLAPPPGNP